jgi:signal transduction histidine kinase/streptogramin lyase
VQGVCASRDGGVWVGVDGKVRKFKDGVLADDLGPAPWGLAGLNQMLETQDGDIVGGTVDSGLHLLTPEKTVLSFTRTNGLMPENWVRSLFEDRERNMWVGSGSGGLVALRRAKVSVLTPPDHWQGRAVLSVTARNTNDIWVGTEGAGVYRSHMGVWSQLGAETGLSHLFAWTVSQDAEGRIWVGTWGGGIFLEENGKFNRVPKLEDLRTPTQAIYHGKGGVTWIGTDDGLLRYEGGKVVQYGEAEGLQVPHVRTMLESPDGTLWFGMFGGGLGSLSGGALKQYGIRDGLTSEFVQCLKLDSEGALWIGTSGGGLFRFKNGRFAAITKAQGLPDNVICDIEADGRGYFWMSSHAGIIRASKAELNACADGVTNQIDCLTYARGEGMPTLECSGGLQPAGCRTADGKLWFATSKGLVRLDPEEVKRNSLPPPVLIEELKVDDKTQSPQPQTVKPKTSSPRTQTAITDNVNTQDFRIAPGAHRYEFTFTALSFTVPEKVRFRYRLEGLDPHWTDAGTKRSVNYSYIPPGSYTFRVTACNNDGVWNEIGAAVTLTVFPQFWQTWWFRLLAVIFSAALVTAVVVLVTRRRMREKMDRLERQRAVERERTRIARDIHDDLGASLTRITMLSQSARAELENSTAAADVDRIYDTARELTRAMDEIVWAVNPKHDTLDSLATYLGRFAQGFLAASHVSCRLDLPMQLPSWPVTAETRHNLFLAFKESLNNAIKHSGTKEVHVSMDMADAGFSLVVEDTGCGFEANGAARPRAEFPRTATGNGFLHMRQRLDEIGGQCEIMSSPGKGTKVVFVVPVKLAKP